ncbi:MAG: cyclic nucleotide-binding domain-containing protein, partial [Alphaproteobacteria bacterium]
MARRDDSPLAVLEVDPLFSGAPASALASLVGTAEAIGWEDGESIYRRGEPADALVLVTCGRVRLTASGRVTASIDTPGRCGEEAAGLGVRVCDATAAGAVRGFRLPRAALREFAAARPSFAVDATAALSAHLGGEAIVPPERPASRGEPPVSFAEACGWAAVLVLPPLVHLLARRVGFPVEGALFSSILAAVVLL